MAQASHHRFSFEEYVRQEDESSIRHEFLGGQVWAMAGGSPEHAPISANVIATLVAALRGSPCRTYSADLRVRVEETGLATYPDVTVVCGPVELDPADPKRHTVTNPRVIVEVLSPSTEDYDRGEKLRHYQRIASLEALVLVASDRRSVEVVRRAGASWARSPAGAGDTVVLAGVSVAVDAMYGD